MTQFTHVTRIPGIRPPSPQEQQELGLQRWVESRINGGMVTALEPTNIPTNVMQLVQNANVRYDRTQRRPGSTQFTPVKPDANEIIALADVVLEDGSTFLMRHTPSSVYALEGVLWHAYAATLHGTIEDRLNYVDVLNTICFSNNGVDPIQTINFGTRTIATLGDAPAYRYITGFFNRVVAAALQGTNEVQIGWSGDGNPTEWNPVIDQTAGNTPLIDTPADLSDWIKGIFAFANVMIILRQKSVWLANKQAIPTNPFYFYTAIPGIGCDCPYSAQVVSGGLAWADVRTRSVYFYQPGGQLTPIGRPIENALFNSINDVNTVFSAYNATFDEYTVYVPTVGSAIVQGWTFNFRTQAWTYNEYLNISSAVNFPIATGTLAYEDLVGTYIGLTGTYGTLSPTSLVDTRAFGRIDGDIMYEDISADNDMSVAFNTILVSKTFEVPSYDMSIAQVRFDYEATRAGPILMEFSIDDGNTWFTAKTITPTTLGVATLFIFRRLIRCRRFMFRLTASAGVFTPLSYEVWTYKGGESRR